ncbi:MAG: hypothetical protein DME59_01060 [Verrucomicrobia bacterium]|nr:MAG: hypothetical protein DME59_01060 [Verrucomicrobiota bacterium]
MVDSIGHFAFLETPARARRGGMPPAVKRIERWGTARWTVKPARVAGVRVGTRESIGRRQNKMPGELLIGHFAFLPMLGSERALAFTNSYSGAPTNAGS